MAKQLRNPHPVVDELRADPVRLRVRSATRGRALRILDALAKAAAKRGYQVQAPKPGGGYGAARGCFQVSIHGYVNVVDLAELYDRVPHHPTALAPRGRETASWTRVRDHVYVPSGRLRVTLLHGLAVQQDSFCDAKTIRPEDRLRLILRELELRAADDEARERQREHERRELQRRWEAARDEAIGKARDQHRAQVLTT